MSLCRYGFVLSFFWGCLNIWCVWGRNLAINNSLFIWCLVGLNSGGAALWSSFIYLIVGPCFTNYVLKWYLLAVVHDITQWLYSTCLGSLLPMKKVCRTRPSGRPPLLQTPSRSDVWPQESQITVRLLRLYSLSAPLVLWAPCRGRHTTVMQHCCSAGRCCSIIYGDFMSGQHRSRSLPCRHRPHRGTGCGSLSSWPFPDEKVTKWFSY